MMMGNSEQDQNGCEGGMNINVVDGDGMHLKKGPWTASEDAILTDYVRKHGEGNWNAVQRNTGLARCGKSCRLRWANHLRPNLKKGAFSPEEERLIVELHAQLGNKWARMAAQLPGRTDNEIKNYWNTRVKRRHRQGLPLYPSDVQPQYRNQQQQNCLNSPHSNYPSQPTTPTTPPNNTFSFQPHHLTPPATPPGNHNYLSPYNHHSTPPPQSPPPTTFPTLTLFESNAYNGNGTTTTSHHFNMPRSPPPLIQSPLRFKRFHSDTNLNAHLNDDDTHNFHHRSYSVPFSPFLRPSSLMTNGLLSSPSYAFTTPVVSSPIPRTQFENSIMSSTGNNSSIFEVKPTIELPSSQFLFQNGNNNTDLNFENDKLQSVSSSGSGLLEDLLEEAQALAGNYGDTSSRRMSTGMCSMEDHKRGFSGFNNTWSSDSNLMNLGMQGKEIGGEGQMMNTMNEDMSKLLSEIPCMQVPEWFSDSGEAISNGQSNSVLTDENIGLEMQQHMASLFTNEQQQQQQQGHAWQVSQAL